MDVVESDVGPINKAALHVALTVAAFLVEDEVICHPTLIMHARKFSLSNMEMLALCLPPISDYLCKLEILLLNHDLLRKFKGYRRSICYCNAFGLTAVFRR